MRAMKMACALIVLMVSAMSARAAERYDPAALAKTIEPYLDDTTLMVAHADMTQMDFGPLTAKLMEFMRLMGRPQQQAAMQAQLEQGIGAARQWIDQFTKAGGRDIYVVLSAGDFPDSPVYVVAPVRTGVDAQGLARTLASVLADKPETGMEVREDVVIWGSKVNLERLKSLKPAPRPQLAKAFEAAGDSTAQILFVPSDDARKVLSEMMPSPPAELVGPNGGDLMGKVAWVGAGANLSPEVGLNITIQSPDEASAAALGQTLTRVIDVARQMMAQALRADAGAARMIGDVDALAKAFTPAVNGNQLTIRLGADPSMKLAGIVLPAMAKARQQAGQSRSMSNMRQIVMGCLMYADEHKGEFPPDLQSISATADLPAGVFKHPEMPEKEVGYVYLRPSKGAATVAGASQIVVYEDWQGKRPTLNVAFADGHVERMDSARFERALALSKERNQARGQ
jgi:prepilin-type processing-associated H-X9-DG protein